MRFRSETWFDPRLEVAQSEIDGRGLFVTEDVDVGETLMVWGGSPYTIAQLSAGEVPAGVSYSEVDDDVILAGPADGLDYFLNHSCDPNSWMGEDLAVIARLHIPARTEVTINYSMVEGEASYRLVGCRCGAADCRGIVTGGDWKLPELRRRYRGHFLPFLERRQ